MAAAELSIRPYRPGDEAEVLALLSGSLGAGPQGERTADFFRWKHVDNPFGPSTMLVGEVDGRVVGLRAFMRWDFTSGGRSFRAVRAVDTATDPGHRGRGVFSRLTLAGLDAVRGDVDFVFNTPNRASGAGYLKMGWRLVGRPRVGIRLRRPVRFLRGFRRPGHAAGAPSPVEAETATEALADEEAVAGLLEGVDEPGSLLHTPRSVAFLRWRYAEAPGLDYRAIRSGSSGLVLFRVRDRGALRECAIADVIVRPGDRGTAGRLLARAIRSAPVDHATCLFPPGSAARRAASTRGFVPRRGPILTVRPMREELRPDPTELRSWGFALGDLEVF